MSSETYTLGSRHEAGPIDRDFGHGIGVWNDSPFRLVFLPHRPIAHSVVSTVELARAVALQEEEPLFPEALKTLIVQLSSP